MPQFYFVFFGYSTIYFNVEKLVDKTMQQLHQFYFKNESIILSKNVILIAKKRSEINNYPSVQNIIDDIMREQNEKINIYDITLPYFVIPVQLTDIEDYIKNFQKEIEYIKLKLSD